MSNLLKKYVVDNLGIIGLKNEFKLCHIPFLVVNDVFGVMCLVGSSGTGKTTLIKRIGKLNELATGGRVGVFSADKARYEDFIGCPIPNEESGEMKIYPMPNSVAQMETVLIDEINRASYENQEKWLSLCATREIDGIQTKCKYLYAAMNPLLSEGTDVYEGVQPLDKALGERVMGLIEVPSFYKLPSEARRSIIQGAFKQVEWTPTDELVTAHIEYLKRAREIYEELKNTYIDAISDYIDNIQADLKKETKGVIVVEARRAQFLMTNILATHALDLTEENKNIELSALNALLSSFPNALWEQVVNREALRAAHNKSCSLLKISADARKKSAANYDGIERPLQEILKSIEDKNNKSTKEQVSKTINQNIPDEKEDPINHYVYACGIYLSLTSDVKNGGKQIVMKEQEFARIQKIYDKLVSNDKFKYFSDLNEQLKLNKGVLPSGFRYPEYIQNDKDEEATDVFKQLLTVEVGTCALTIASLQGVEVNNAQELVMIVDKITKVMYALKSLKEYFKANKSLQ